MLDDPSADANTIINPLVRSYLERLNADQQRRREQSADTSGETPKSPFMIIGWHVVLRPITAPPAPAAVETHQASR
jgi:hypothetical protein